MHIWNTKVNLFLGSRIHFHSMTFWGGVLVKDGKLIKTYVGGGGVFGLDWNSAGDKVAASFSDNTVCVIDMRM